MLLVADMNILFSFFKKHTFTRKLLSNPNLELYSPIYALDELNKYSQELISKSKINTGTFELYKKVLSWFIKFIPVSEYKEFKDKADSISPDPNDTQYFALALKLNCPIWSNDKKLKEQSEIKVLNTSELIELLK